MTGLAAILFCALIAACNCQGNYLSLIKSYPVLKRSGHGISSTILSKKLMFPRLLRLATLRKNAFYLFKLCSV